MTKIVAVGALKGGSGKTTTVMGLAIAAHNKGIDVSVVDLDPQAGIASATGWIDAAELDIAVFTGKQAAPVIRQAVRRDPDLVLIDTGPSDSARLTSASDAADLLIIPVSTGNADLARIRATLAATEGTPSVVLINRARPRHLDETRDVLHENGIETTKTSIANWAKIERLPGESHQPETVAVLYEALLNEITER